MSTVDKSKIKAFFSDIEKNAYGKWRLHFSR